jgi:hypothetical protein
MIKRDLYQPLTVIDQDLKTLLPSETFSKIRKILKPEVLTLIRQEIARLS